MSGLWLLMLISTWAFAGWLIYRLWRRWKPAGLARKMVHVALGLVAFSIWLSGGFWEFAGKKMYWDSKVRELCEMDGGVKVYEQVELPADKFNKWGQINFENPTKGEDVLGPEYLVKEQTQFLIAENEEPTMMKFHYQVLRRSDMKLLGERISYARRGGDMPGPWQSSSYRCPDNSGDLSSAIFIKSKQQK